MFQNSNGGNMTFARFNGKTGKFDVKKDGEKLHFNQLRDVLVTKIDTRDDEYEGKPRTDLQVRVTGKDGNAIISFNTASGSTAKLVALLNAVDLTKPLGLSGQMLAAGTTPKGFTEPLQNDLVSISVFQDGWVKSAVAVPKTVMVKVGNKDVADTSAREEFVAKTIAELMGKVGNVSSEAAATAENAVSTDEESDLIPF